MLVAVGSVLRRRTPSFLVEQKVEVAGGVGLNGVELSVELRGV